MLLSNGQGNWYGLGRELLWRAPSCNQHLSLLRKEKSAYNLCALLKKRFFLLILNVLWYIEIHWGKLCAETHWLSHVQEMWSLFGIWGLCPSLTFYSPTSSFKKEHLWFYPKPEVDPGVPQCVLKVVCPFAKNRLIMAILAVPGKVDFPSHFCFCVGRAPSE